MVKIEAIIKPSKLDDVKAGLTALGIGGMTITDVRGSGRQPIHTETFRGATYTIDLMPKIKLEVVVADRLMDRVVSCVCAAARTGSVGDGKVFVLPIDQAMRIRTGEAGEVAV